jgi:predicted flavoprotein YhiN
MADIQVDVLVIGAGPTGLGAAKRLDHIVSSPLSALALLARFTNFGFRTVRHG